MEYDMSDFYNQFYDDLGVRLRDADASALEELCLFVLGARKDGKKVVVVGNGGSAAIASHVAVDLTKVLKIRTVNFNEADLITCFANDYGYENWVTEAVRSYGDAGDVAVLISSSGQSANILNGARRAREQGMKVVTLSGFNPDNPLRQLGDVNLWVNSTSYNIVESVHQTWLLAVVDRLAADEAHK
jgi:D-sedoheptulose 7-phosphate isomerase